MSLEKAKEDLKKLNAAKFKIVAAAEKENRELTAKEEIMVSELDGAINGIHNELQQPLPAVTLQNGYVGGSDTRTNRKGGLIPPTGRKGYTDLFGKGGFQWQDKDVDFFQAVFSGRAHPGLVASMSETVPSDGGFLVPTETASKIHAVSLESELVMPRAYVQPMQSNEMKIPAMYIGDHSSSLFGGFSASYTAELGTISENSPKARSMTLSAKKLTGLIRFSSELAADCVGGFDQIVNLCGKGLSWYRDQAFLKGSGAGQPLGILNSGCLVTVEAELGQGSGTIIYDNLTKMMSRMFAGSFANSVWIVHQSAIPQLLGLTIPVGTGGSHIQVMRENNGQFSILTRPVIFTEKTETLGSKGDIILADFSQYVVGLRSEMRFDTSAHVHFSTDELLSRIIERHDGQPLWDSALTLADGTTTVSPFVTLAARE
jgi:HK97 family phage major capsid protein